MEINDKFPPYEGDKGDSNFSLNLPDLPSREKAIESLGNNKILALGLAFAAAVAAPIVTAGLVFAFTVEVTLSIALSPIALAVGLVALAIILKKEFSEKKLEEFEKECDQTTAEYLRNSTTETESDSDDEFDYSESDSTNKDHSPKRRDTIVEFAQFDISKREETEEELFNLMNELAECENNELINGIEILIKIEKLIQGKYENKEVYVSFKIGMVTENTNQPVLLRKKLEFMQKEIQGLLAHSENLPKEELSKIFESYPEYFINHLGPEISTEGIACIIDELVESYLNAIPKNNESTFKN